MELTQEERDILDGKQGETLAKVMRTLVEYGETFGATRMVKVTAPGHLVTSFGISILEANFRLMDELIKAGLKTKEPFTVDPRPIDNADVPASVVQKVVGAVTYGKQDSYERQLRAVGLKDENAFTCASGLLVHSTSTTHVALRPSSVSRPNSGTSPTMLPTRSIKTMIRLHSAPRTELA